MRCGGMRWFPIRQRLFVVGLWLASLNLLFPSMVRASDLHVDPNAGDDNHDGAMRPVKTIARAIRLAMPGDTIHLRPLTYRDWA